MSTIKRVRGKTLALVVNPSFNHEELIELVTTVNLRMIRYDSPRLPDLKAFRKLLDPAYRIVATMIEIGLKDKKDEVKINPIYLNGLQIQLLPACGYYVIEVAYRDKEIATSYKLRILPKDGMSVALRVVRHPVKLVGTSNLELTTLL